MEPTTARGKRPRLTRQTVLEAGLELVDGEGLQGLTMRRLGRMLDVEAMALYHHVEHKDDLLDGVLETLLGRLELPSNELDWREWLREVTRSYRRLAHAHPNAFPLVALRPLTTPAALRPIEAILQTLARAGFDEEGSLGALQTISSYASGYALEEIAGAGGEGSQPHLERLAAEEFPRLHALAPLLAAFDPNARFEFGLDVILAGLDVQLAAARRL